MSGFLGAFKTRKPKQFNFVSRYYDEKKERLQRAESRIQRQIEFQKSNADSPDGFRNERVQFNWQRTDRLAQQKKSNQRILIIIGILAAIVYVALQYV
ncbi:MAG: hypothetical protein HOB26_06200 [Flavobacteriales bacterium]|jgi:hypothetical protein|nr:hypothetical protein [Flavobacteriales bacterium]MBT6746127.1 hypothetical protein [Flavobacteriales bacterium]